VATSAAMDADRPSAIVSVSHRWTASSCTHAGSRRPLAHLEARHRAHARVEDRIRCAKSHGLGRLPSRQFAIDAVWVELALTAADLLAWTQTTLLADDLVTAEPATLRYPKCPQGRSTEGSIPSAWPD
jgi:hypothetical protein